MRVVGKDSDSDPKFTAIGGFGASCNPSASYVYITVRGTLTCFALPGWFKYEEVTVLPVWTPQPAGMTREAHVSDTINLPGPILYTLTHTASVPEVLEPFSAGTRVHAATVYASGP